MTRYHQTYDDQHPPQPVLTPFTPEEEAATDASEASADQSQSAIDTPIAAQLIATISAAVDRLRSMGVSI